MGKQGSHLNILRYMIKVPLITTHTNYREAPAGATKVRLDCHNWADQYPYAPFASVYLWHDNRSVFLHFVVDEKYISAQTNADNGKVSKDSCVEFFISLNSEGYYNIEANCIGKVLLSHRLGRKINVEYADENILNKIERFPSSGNEPFQCKENDKTWTLTLRLPSEVFFKDCIEGLSGLKGRCNLYKCGDNLPEPHFMSWQAVKTENPDFHRPEYFGEIEFL